MIICKVFKYQEFVYTNKKMWVGQTGTSNVENSFEKLDHFDHKRYIYFGVRVGQTRTSNVKRSLLKILIICKVFKYQELVYTNKKMRVGQTGTSNVRTSLQIIKILKNVFKYQQFFMKIHTGNIKCQEFFADYQNILNLFKYQEFW